MKLLICTSEYPPRCSGIGNVAYNVVEQLKKRGIECTVCSPTGPDIILGNDKIIKYIGFFGLLYYWFRVSLYFHKNAGYDVAWLHSPYFILNNPFPKNLVTIHTTYFGMSRSNAGNTLFLKTYNKTVSIIEQYCLRKIRKTTSFSGVSKAVCEELVQIGIPPKHISYIPNGVNITKFHPADNKIAMRKIFGIPEDEIALLSIGRLTPQKQPITLVDIFSNLQKRLPKVVLFISGKGELRNSLRDHGEKMHIKNIRFLGYIPDKEIPNLYAASDFFIMTSKYEGMPLTLLEAMASGLPCIVSDIPHLEIVKDANCGTIVHFDDIKNATDNIADYLQGNQSDHSNNARNYAINMLAWEIIAQRYYDALNS